MTTTIERTGANTRPSATLLRIATAGSVDDGKSTLIGRLLYDSKAVMEDQLAAVERTSQERGNDYTDLALVTDGLRAEREQGITIDVAYRYFATSKRKFIIADTPGHIQYTRNMVTGTSTAHLAIVLVDARHGLLEQSRRHAFLASLLGIQHVVLAVNKMDLIDWDQERFNKIRDDFHNFAARLDIHDVTAIPLSALHGDNVVSKSEHTPWYEGPPLLTHLEEVYIAGDRNLVDVRFPVQYVIRPQTLEHQDHRSYAGTVASGVMRVGDEVIVLPAGIETTISAIEGPSGPVDEAFPPMAVSISLADDIDISRGDMIARPNNQPRVTTEFDATVCWMADDSALEPGRDYLIKHTTRTTRVRVTALDYRLDVNTLHRDKDVTALKLNELGRISLRSQQPLLLDEYSRNQATGSFILIDPNTNGTVAAGMVLPQVTARTASPNTVRHESLCKAEDRLTKGRTVWFTGLSGSGKSSVAMLVERKLIEKGVPAYVLDGDNLRHGLNSDLGFSMADRAENQRRLAHVAAILADSGQVVLVPAISPLEEHRELARKVTTEAGLEFYEVFCDTPLEDCERRDPKGLYAKARAGEITHFTGIDSPYQRPKNPDLRLTPDHTPEELADMVIEMLEKGQR
ncbi:sulfate adenylyltransferase, large subunit [Mycolicibacterium phlei]|jgi:bifunctional enzyme CysN/CysC|uniref:Multifunctional fusion protein n=1 Tax=Mycolicibacterium phlei DSM 43239 = CCUG 21000 TaxID=1226750 RepID=A0A5N5V209_MYCPH|nr:sulfate adenylyltransferase subunit CysN [Mycolicibacterium phlei]VEG10844.1 sulfate adenylyltransferase, large subunit [Mycobacteroides chelonae]AMO62743.1 Bifunctional enzyme CysN/CysC [Mycolicibacterium phlei]EID14441.1 bifunctional sulfate adenylyltransferase subunit 1/adenylylsulfate kinase protein [Mycolicibacterium phlei RIVM601174]KAB7755931.1 adenylylsulfate kinase [Mycolicibacterium phlei DSM 43239 = CCUG 21000]KXW65888.1 adenylylsulfate kinase [Mycolicibacterium phlei DSM 43239 =